MYAKFIEEDGRFEFLPRDNGGVEITEADYASLFAKQPHGKVIVPDSNGRPVLADPPAPTLEERIVAVDAKYAESLDRAAKLYLLAGISDGAAEEDNKIRAKIAYQNLLTERDDAIMALMMEA